jgi:hypothetical protein
MSLTAGTKLGTYEIIFPLGAAGMAACGRASAQRASSPSGVGVELAKSAGPEGPASKAAAPTATNSDLFLVKGLK